MLTILKNDPKLASLALAAFGIFLLLCRAVYDLAARVSLAKKEYAAIMASGLISSEPLITEDPSLRERLLEQADTLPGQPEISYRTAPLAKPFPGQQILQDPAQSAYRTAPLKEVSK